MNKFYLLSLTEHHIKFFKIEQNNLEEINLTNIPHSVDEAIGAKSMEKQLQTHSSSSQNEGIHHGHTDDTDFSRNHLETLLRKVDHGVTEYLRDKQEPLMLATVEKTFGLYKQINSYPHLLTNKFLHGSCDKMNTKELQQKAWEVFKF